MSMPIRAVISVLAGIGSGAIGFWAMWKIIGWATSTYPGNAHQDPWLLIAIFAPLIGVSALVFLVLGRSQEQPTHAAE